MLKDKVPIYFTKLSKQLIKRKLQILIDIIQIINNRF